ncbi:MAG: 4-alpha-glucanotransferase [Candidatus Melainabacteria bacterium]|nr:4-alpha-glucanotransferase [Candidatus Melainabacteria bacterium]
MADIKSDARVDAANDKKALTPKIKAHVTAPRPMQKRIDPNKKKAGLLLPVFALRSAKGTDLGVGDTACVIEALHSIKSWGMSVLQLLPINETGPDNSPYNAISSIALDPVYITIDETVPGYHKDMIQKHLSAEEAQSLRSKAVQYARVKSLKLNLLHDCWESFKKFEGQGDDSQFKSFEKFELDEKDWLQPYSVFRVLVEQNHGNVCWTMWPKEYQDPESALQSIYQQSTDLLNRARFYRYVQWVAFSQWARVKEIADDLGLQLMGDIPFGVSRYSADVWSDRATFDLKWSGGAPPERYFQSDRFTQMWGQNWGIPLYNWTYLGTCDYAFWRRRVQKTTQVFHHFRIDHVLGFFRIYAFPWIPERNGEFLDLSEEEAELITGGVLPHFIERDDETIENCNLNCQQGEKLLSMILDTAGDCGVVAEDLGVVPDYVRPCLKALGIPGFTIPIFERVEEDRSFKALDSQEPLSLVTYGTHDHDPVRVFYENLCKVWHGPDGHQGWLEVQRFMKFIGWDENSPPDTFSEALHERLLEVLMQSPCWLAVLMVSDLFGTSQRFNVPGIAGDSNWSERLEMSFADYERTEPYMSKIAALKKYIKETSRI